MCIRDSYICVQLPENLDVTITTADQKAKAIIQNAIAFLTSIGKPHYLTEIGKERIRRAGAKLLERQGDQIELGEEEKAPLDIGFKVFKLDSSNLKPWDGTPVSEENVQMIFRADEQQDPPGEARPFGSGCGL